MAVYQTHFGEDIVKNQICKLFGKVCNIWIPSKDTGIDILLTDKQNQKTVSLQVKWSKNHNNDFKLKDLYRGWFTFKYKKLQNSQADFWVIVIPSNFEKKYQYVIVKPQDLLNNYTNLGLNSEIVQSYFDIFDNRVFESRGLKQEERPGAGGDLTELENRELKKSLNNWDLVISKLK